MVIIITETTILHALSMAGSVPWPLCAFTLLMLRIGNRHRFEPSLSALWHRRDILWGRLGWWWGSSDQGLRERA